MKLNLRIAGLALPILLVAMHASGQSISSFDPPYGSVGNTVNIFGSGFSVDTMTVRFFNNVVATAHPTSDSQIVATVPSGAATGVLSVQRNSLTPVSTSSNFTVIGAGPYISGYSPTSGNVGDTVTLSGAHFSSANGVKFNGVSASFNTPTTDTALTVFVPNGAMSGPITVLNPSGSWTTSSNFYMPPQITGFSPTNGRTGSNVFIAGKSFTNATAIKFNGFDATSFNVNSSTQIVAVVPTNATTGVISVFTPAFSFATSSNFTVQPTILGFSPGFGPAGTSVTITGANLNAGSLAVKFNGVAASIGTPSFSSVTSTVPISTTGPITLTTVGGSATSSVSFYYPAGITGFIPNNSPPGSTVTISGVNLTNTSVVTFNGQSASFTPPTNNTTLFATVPAGVITGPIGVTTPAGTTNSGILLFYGAPVIISFTPTHGSPGTNVVISGTNFLGATAVQFNGTNASFSVVNNGTINATVPTNTQTGLITVVGPAGTNTSSGNFVFDSADVGVMVADSPDPVLVTSNLTYTIVVSNSGPSAVPGVMLTNTLPSSANLKSASAPGPLTTNGNRLVCNLGSFNVGDSATVTFIVAPQSVGTITNVATVGGLFPDPVSANNTVVTLTTVQPLPVLSVRPSTTNVVRISWPSALTNYGLQFTPVLAATDYWTNVAATSQIIGNESVILQTNDAEMQFYRLKRQP